MPKPVKRRVLAKVLRDSYCSYFDSESWKRLQSAPEGSMLPMMLSAAVPLWMAEFKELSVKDRLNKLKQIDQMENPNFCELMEFTLHRGKPGQSALAFNTLAKAIALMAVTIPGGVTAFGHTWEFQRVKVLK